MQATRDFVSEEPRKFSFRIGKILASSLSGFITGALLASLIWGIAAWYYLQVQKAANLINPATTMQVVNK